MKINKDDESQAKKITRSVYNTEAILIKLNTNIKSLMCDLESVGTRMKDISQCFLQLQGVFIMEYEDVSYTYKMLNNLTSKWSAGYPDQVSMINLELRELFDYMRKETTAFKSV